MTTHKAAPTTAQQLVPTVTHTINGKPIAGTASPVMAMAQTELLTLNVNDLPMLKNALGKGVHAQVLRADLENGEYAVLATFEPGSRVPIHYHTGCVDGFTLSGSWHYLEYADQLQTAGSYLYEPGSSLHTLSVPETNTENTVVYFRIHGANINFTDDGEFHSILDAASVRALVMKLGAEQNLGPVRFIGGGAAGIVTENQ